MKKLRTLGLVFFIPVLLLLIFSHVPAVEFGHRQNITNIQYAGGDFSFEQLDQVSWNQTDDINKIDREQNNTLWVKFTLPAQISCVANCHLYINQIYEIYEVYFEEKQVYKYGDFQEPHKFYGRNLNLIPLHSLSPANQTVYFKVHSELSRLGLKGIVLIGEKADLVDFLYKKSFVQFGIVFIIMMFFALYFFILGLRKGQNGAYLLLALYLASHATHTFTGIDIKFFLYNSPAFWEHIRQYCNDAIPITFILFIRSFFNEYSKITLFRWWTNLIFCTHVVFLGILIGYEIFNDSGIKYVSATLGEIGTLNFLITVIVIIVITLNKATTDTKILACGIVCYLIFNFYDNFLKLFNVPYKDSIIPYGLLFMLLSIVVIHIRRISEVYRNQETYLLQLEEYNKQLERLSKVKDEFLANTSHELQTPLNGIIGITESVLDNLDGPVEAVRKHLTMVISSGKRLSNLVNDLLDFSKLKHRELELHKQNVDLTQLLQLVIAVNKTLVKGTALQFVDRVTQPLYVYGDENRIQQILFNLIGNAIKFTEKGTITIEGQQLDKFVEIRISDTGIGIPKEQLETIFQSFEQADSSISRKYGGTGLGLAITKQLVEIHGGAIRVESVVGQGSVFIFTLPAASEKTSSTPELSIAEPILVNQDEIAAEIALNETHPIQILIVDDDPINIQVILNHLAAYNWGTVVASNGWKALDILSRKKIDLMLLDVMMPNMSGYEVCEKVRETFEPDELPVIMLTARNTADDIARGFESGANDYITKPFLKKELLARIEARLKLLEFQKSKPLFTKTEKTILTYYYEHRGETRRQILERINNDRGDNPISEKTLITHITNLLKKINASNMIDAVEIAKRKNFI